MLIVELRHELEVERVRVRVLLLLEVIRAVDRMHLRAAQKVKRGAGLPICNCIIL